MPVIAAATGAIIRAVTENQASWTDRGADESPAEVGRVRSSQDPALHASGTGSADGLGQQPARAGADATLSLRSLARAITSAAVGVETVAS